MPSVFTTLFTQSVKKNLPFSFYSEKEPTFSSISLVKTENASSMFTLSLALVSKKGIPCSQASWNTNVGNGMNSLQEKKQFPDTNSKR